MEKLTYQIIFEQVEAAGLAGEIHAAPIDDYSDYAEIAELSRLAEAIREPEPHSFTIG